MGVYTRPAQLMAAQIKRYQQHAPGEIAKVTEDLAKLGADDIRDSTGGPLKEKQLRAMGHPYAKRARTAAQLLRLRKIAKAGTGLVQNGQRQVSRSGRVNPLPINRWTGRVQAGIFTRKAGKAAWDVGSRAKHAKYLFAPKGTKYMVPRGVMGERRKHGVDGIVRKRHRVRVQAYVVAMRKTHRKP